jgi:hypothetical protein
LATLLTLWLMSLASISTIRLNYISDFPPRYLPPGALWLCIVRLCVTYWMSVTSFCWF